MYENITKFLLEKLSRTAKYRIIANNDKEETNNGS